jgi:hypothetical protein
MGAFPSRPISPKEYEIAKALVSSGNIPPRWRPVALELIRRGFRGSSGGRKPDGLQSRDVVICGTAIFLRAMYGIDLTKNKEGENDSAASIIAHAIGRSEQQINRILAPITRLGRTP